MRLNKHLLAWTLLLIVLAVAFTFSDTYVVAADNSTNNSNSTSNTTTNTSIIPAFLEIWDTNFVYVNETVMIFANYSYEQGPIIGVDICSFDQDYMSFNMTSGLYYYFASYETSGNHTYEIFCSKTGYENKTEFGIVEVLDSMENNTNQTNITITDNDNDGYSNETDCNDNNPNINPGMQEVFYNDIDDDCNPGTLDYVLFDINTNKQSYLHQENVIISIDALNESDTYLTINTPTNVSYVYIFANGSYPATQQFSLTTITGEYSIDAINYYGDYTNFKTVNFSVANTMAINIVVDDDSVDVGQKIHVRADITGNIGNVNMIWNMDDGNEKYTQEFDYTYDYGRTYNIVLIASDQGGNQVIKTKSIVVRPKYFLKAKVINNKTGEIIPNATVELDNDDKKVNSTGYVEYNVTNKTYNLEAFAQGYYSYDENIKINNSLSFTIKLIENPGDIIPTVSLVSPANNSEKTSSEFKFKFNDNGNATCTLYVSEGEGWWLDVNESKDLKPNIEYTFKPQLEAGNYYWKIQCRDKDNNVGSSKEYYLELRQDTISFSSSKSETEETYAVVQNVFDVIPDFNTYSPDEKKIAEYLSMDVLIKDAIRKLEMANRDLFNLNNEVNTQSILDKRDEIYKQIDEIKEKTPLSIRVQDKADFVKYPNEEELELLFDEYISLKNIELNKRERLSLLEKNNFLQKKVSVRTLVYYVEIQYISGRTEEVTLIARTFDTDETADDINYVEFVPKDIIEDTEDIVFLNKPDNILKQDPVFEIQLNKGKEFVYYVKEKIDLDIIPKIQVAAISTILTEQDSMLTGMAVFDKLGFSESNKNIFLIQIVVVFVLLGIYLFFYFSSNATFALFSWPSFNLKFLKNKQNKKIEQQDYVKSPVLQTTQTVIPIRKTQISPSSMVLSTDEQHKINYMNQVIEKAHNLININLEKAALYYHEVKFLYELLSDDDKEIMHESVLNLADEINYNHVNKLVDDAVIELAHNNLDNTQEIYENIQTEFEKLPDNYKESLYKKCCEIALHLK